MRENNRNDKRNFERRDGKKRDFKGKRDYRDRDRKQEVQQADEEFTGGMVEGRNAVIEAFRSGKTVDKLFVLASSQDGPIRTIIREAKKHDTIINYVEKERLDELSTTGKHQGVIAQVASYSYATVEDILARAEEKGEPPFILLLDGIEDPHNLGAIIRTANLAGAHGVIVPKHRAVGLTATVAKTSAGALNYTPVAKVTNLVQTMEMLKEKGIAVYFQKENINTLDAKGEVMITIMASLAQQESESISKNVKLGIDFRNKQGKVQVNHNRFLGYTKDAEGHLIIDPEQAEVVKRIYRKYLEGASMDMICHGLEADGILTGAGNKKWYTSTVKKILTNEKYIGDALLQKTCTIDILNKTRVANNGIAPQYYVEDDHEAIIPKEIYMKVQEELVRRRNVQASPSGKKRMYSCTHCFSQMVVCGSCGEVFRRIHWNNHGCRSIVWRCASRLE